MIISQMSISIEYITDFRADAFLNASNGELNHIGEVVDSVLKKGGQLIQQESVQYV